MQQRGKHGEEVGSKVVGKGLARNAKALSPVIATIILVAVTVVVAIAATAWMGSLSFTYLKAPEELQFTNTVVSASNANLTVRNGGSSRLTIDRVYIDEVEGTSGVSPQLPLTLAVGGMATITITPTVSYTPGVRYTVKLVTAQGNQFPTVLESP